jgi:hypothetical protein
MTKRITVSSEGDIARLRRRAALWADVALLFDHGGFNVDADYCRKRASGYRQLIGDEHQAPAEGAGPAEEEKS